MTRCELPVSTAAVESTTTAVKSSAASAVEACASTVSHPATVERTYAVSVNCTTAIGCSCGTVHRRASVSISWAVAVTWPVTISGSIAVAPAVRIARVPIVAAAIITVAPTVEPWSGADKDAAYKVARPIVSIRCASIGSVTVISISADGCRADGYTNRTNADTHCNLGLRLSCGKNQNS